MTLIILIVVGLVVLMLVIKFLRFLFSAGHGPALHDSSNPPKASPTIKLKSPTTEASRTRSARMAEDQRKRNAEQATAAARRSAQAAEDQRRRAAEWARNPINPMNPNSRLNPANPLNPNNPMNPSNPMNPINRNRR